MIRKIEKIQNFGQTANTVINHAARALWDVLIEFEKFRNKDTTKNISGNYKEHLYGKNGILK